MGEIFAIVVCLLFAAIGYVYGFAAGVEAEQSDSQTHT